MSKHNTKWAIETGDLVWVRGQPRDGIQSYTAVVMEHDARTITNGGRAKNVRLSVEGGGLSHWVSEGWLRDNGTFLVRAGQRGASHYICWLGDDGPYAANLPAYGTALGQGSKPLDALLSCCDEAGDSYWLMHGHAIVMPCTQEVAHAIAHDRDGQYDLSWSAYSFVERSQQPEGFVVVDSGPTYSRVNDAIIGSWSCERATFALLDDAWADMCAISTDDGEYGTTVMWRTRPGAKLQPLPVPVCTYDPDNDGGAGWVDGVQF